MELESWLILEACALLTFCLLWKLRSANNRINEIRDSTYADFMQDSGVFRQLDEASNQLAEKDRYISQLSEDVSELRYAGITNMRLGEENIALKKNLSAVKEQVKTFQDKVSEREKQLLQAEAEVTHWRNEAQKNFMCSAQFLEMNGEIAELKKRCETAELKATEVAAQKSNLTKETEALKQPYQSAEQRNKDFSANNSNLKKENEGLRLRCYVAEKRNEELTRESKGLWEKNDELRQECLQAKNEIEHLTTELRAVSNNFNEYKRKAEEWKHDLNIMTDRIIAMRKDESEKEELKAQLQSLMQRNSNLEALSTMVKKQLHDSTKRTQEIEMKLKAETQQRPQLSSRDMECAICMAEKKCILLRPCMHACVCEQCSRHIDRCPICNVGLTGRERIFL